LKSKEETLKNFIIISITLCVALLSNFLMVLILARIFPPGEYAIYQFSLTFLTFFTIFSNFGLSTTIIQQLSAEEDKESHQVIILFSEGLKWIFLFTTILSLALFFLADLFEGFYQMSGLGIVLKYTSLILLTTNGINYFESAFQGLWKFKFFAVSFISAKLIKVVIVCFTLIVEMPISQVVALFSIASLIQLLILIVATQLKYNYISNLFKFDSKTTKIILKFSTFIFLYILLQNIITQSNQFILAAFVIPSELAYYTIVLWMMTSLSVPAIIFSRFILPYVSHYIRKEGEERKKVDTMYNIIFKYGLLITIPVSFYFTYFSDFVIALIFEPSYYPISTYLKLFIFYLNINMIDVAGSHFLWASDEPKLVYKLYMITSIFTITLSLILIPFYYTFGAIIAIMITQSTYVIYSIRLVKRKNNIKLDPKLISSILKYIISAIIVISFIFLLNLNVYFNLYNIFTLMVFSGIYFGMFLIIILLFRAISIPEIKDFINIFKNLIFKNSD